jgi:phage terminase large subunit GpA-like protein
MSEAHYGRALSDACSGFEALRPPNRVSISKGAAANLVIKQTGGSASPWSAEETPYMVEPMDALASRHHEAVVFVGPARTGKTAGLLLGWMSHIVVNDPGDLLFIQMSKDKAREFSKTDIDRAIRHSPNIAAMLSGRSVDSNTFDTMFRHGMWMRTAWPTVSNVSGSTYRYTACTDYDRIDNAENVDGEGPLFDSMKKRTTTFLSRGMSLVESSPGHLLLDPAWKPATPHEAPPTGGILNLYNRSDRQRWYWKCPDCSEHFEAAPGLGLFNLPSDDQLLEEVRTANIPTLAQHHSRVVCPHCGSMLEAKSKKMLNERGIWVPDNVCVDSDGVFQGEPMQSSIKGYWLGGVAATYQNWRSLIENHLIGLRDYALTGSEEKLKQTTNTDQGAPYISRHLVESRGQGGSPQERAEQDMRRYVVPPETRCLLASVDVQGGINSRFVVEVHAVGPHMERWLVDRFDLKDSKRPGMGSEFAPIDPAKFPEDWAVLTDKLLLATWKTPDPTLEIKIKRVTVDSGGEDGVTPNAYAWFRRVRKLGMAGRVRLYKGASTPNAPIVKETMVGRVKGKGDVPLLHCNPNLLSDAVSAGLKRQGPGPGYIHFPAPKHPTNNPNGWLAASYFEELQAETRNKNGVWQKVRLRNEAFDLNRMLHANMLSLGLDQVKNWSEVPAWLAPLDKNSEVVSVEDRRAMKENTLVEIEPQAVRIRAPVKRPRRHAYAAL